MSKIPHYMVELKKRNMENSTFLCKFMCVQAHHTPILYDFTGYVRFSSLSTILF